jgi:type I restriction enzyme, S subunit
VTVPSIKLEEISELITKGTTPTTLGFELAARGVPFLRAQNLIDGHVNVERDPLFISSDVHNALSRSKILAGDILISIAGTIGRAALVDNKYSELNCNQAVAIVRPSSKVNAKFLLHWLNCDHAIKQMQRSQVSATIANLSLGC